MIVFNGITIDSVADVKIEDIRVSPIRYNPVVRPRAVRFGSEFVRMGGGERTVTVSFALLDKNINTRHESIMKLSEWARTDKEYKLELPIDANKYLECVCTSKPEPSTRAWWENKLKLTFTCYSNPYWTSKVEKSFLTSSAYDTTVFIQGDAPPLLRITRNNATTITRTMSIDGVSLTFDSNLPAGMLVIDANNQTATVDNVSAMQYFVPTSTFFLPHPGTNVLRGGGCYFRFRERWQ